VRISAKADYAVRAVVELASRSSNKPVTADDLAQAQGISPKFLLGIMADLRRARLVRGVRGPEGGWLLSKPASDITVADVIRAVDGPLATVQGHFPDQITYAGAAEPVRDVWVALRASMRRVLEGISIADVVTGELPAPARALIADADAWAPR
jgi:Rrf2 family protein